MYNVTDENNPTAILCTDCINITETHYTFTPDYLSPCHVYNFSVIPVNGAGQGESSGNATGYIYKGNRIWQNISNVMALCPSAPQDVIDVKAYYVNRVRNNIFLVLIETHSPGLFCLCFH